MIKINRTKLFSILLGFIIILNVFSQNIIDFNEITTNKNNSLYSIKAGETGNKSVQVNAIDLYGNSLPGVNISMYNHTELIRSDISSDNGSVLFENITQAEYNFTVSITSDIGNHIEVVNLTSEAILINQSLQIVNLICNVGSNFFEIVDIDGVFVDSGWIIVGNSTHAIQNCSINSNGHTRFWWVNTMPYEYNYTVFYQDNKYNPNIIEVASGDITAVNATIQVQVDLTTVEFTVLTIDAPISPVSGAKLKLIVGDPFGASIVNLTTNLEGKATLRWLDSSGIGDDYCLQIELFGDNRLFNDTLNGPANETDISFTVVNKDSLELRISINLNLYQTELISLNPTDYIEVEWGSLLKLRTLFNVSSVETGYEHLLGPSYADSMVCEVLLGGSLVLSGSFLEELDNEGGYFLNLDTSQINSNEIYIIIVSAYKSGYSLPSELILLLNILEIEVELNQSDNDDSVSSAYWLDNVNMTLNSYGQNSETLTIENALFQSVDHEFNFMISDIETHWNLSTIVLNLYNISWNADISDINITIEDTYGTFSYTFDNDYGGWDYARGTWKGITLNLNEVSRTNNNNFEFIISGTFDNTVDIIADAYFIRDAINVQYSQFNISSEISLLTEVEGWIITNVTFEIFECYNSSDWSVVDLSTLTNLNITTNEGFSYSLDYGYLDGTGVLIIDDRTIYPIGNQFLFTVESDPNIIFNAIIKVEYIQGFYKNQFLETLNLTITERGITNEGLFQANSAEIGWSEQEAILWVENINSSLDYFFPSEVAMNITIGGQKFTVSDYALGTGTFSLLGFSKDQILHAVIETSSYMNFNLFLSIQYSRTVSYEIIGSMDYIIVEDSSIYGSVQYDSDLGYYLKTIDTSLLDANDYTVRFTIYKNHYETAIKDLDLIVLNRPTLLNQSSEFFRFVTNIYEHDAVNFTFEYTDELNGNRISNVDVHYYIWESYDQEGNVKDTGEGDIISTLDNTYILDFNTQNRSVGEYLLVLTVDKDNYDRKNGMILLTINKYNGQIAIYFPFGGQVFNATAPNFSVIIDYPNLNTTWYTIDNGGTNKTFTTNCIINQSLWEAKGDGIVTLMFYANDSYGNIIFNSVDIVKDTTAPNITILSPTPNEMFGNKPPDFNIYIIEENLFFTWYNIEGTTGNFNFTGLNGTIDKDAWNNMPEEALTITFFALDKAGHIGEKSVVIIKRIPSPPVIFGYNLVLLIGVTSVISVIILKKQIDS